ncbi:LOW QUALITY PROTEIN: hypothetical protein V3C99_018558, partial [Haemonchus contortus]
SLWHRQDSHRLPYCRLIIRYAKHYRHCHDVYERRGRPVHGTFPIYELFATSPIQPQPRTVLLRTPTSVRF